MSGWVRPQYSLASVGAWGGLYKAGLQLLPECERDESEKRFCRGVVGSPLGATPWVMQKAGQARLDHRTHLKGTHLTLAGTGAERSPSRVKV